MGANGIAWTEMRIDKAEAHFFGIGDWGGAGQPGMSWSNPSKPRPRLDAHVWAQKYVADQMKKQASVSKPDYVLNAGDNFYPGGVNYHCGPGSKDANDPSGQFQVYFENIYHTDDAPDLKGKPWFSVLGNHDYGGMSFTQGWDVQVFQTWESYNWRMPGQYWSQHVQYKDFSVDYFFLDSNFMNSGGDPGHCICQGDGCFYPASANITANTCPDWLYKAWAGGIDMLKKGLGASTAEWRIIVTHFPGFSITGHPDIVPLKDEIDLVFSGHTHYQFSGEDHDIEYIVSGGGGGITSDAMPSPDGNDDAYGFVDFKISRSQLMYEMRSWTNVIRKTKVLTPKRQSKLEKDVLLV